MIIPQLKMCNPETALWKLLNTQKLLDKLLEFLVLDVIVEDDGEGGG